MSALKNKWVWFGAGLVVGIPVVAFGWWLLAPLFLDTEVNEEFPLTENATIPSNISQSEAETVMMTMAKVETKMDEEMPKEMMEATNVVVKSGNFRDGDSFHKGEGTATIYRLADGQQVLRFEDFKVTNGPDLRVLLVNHSNPEGRGDLDSGYEELGKLKGNVGNQNYTIPNSIDVDDYGSIVIYCKPFHVVFSVASLN
ncbi:MAG: DM13 domain-containing protein [Chloroflexi bacterium]|nr:DM13 domain-containing protein [Chloroflexota bacterium]